MKILPNHLNAPVAQYLSEEYSDEDLFVAYWDKGNTFRGQTFPVHRANPERHSQVLQKLRVDPSAFSKIKVVYNGSDESDNENEETSDSDYFEFNNVNK